MEEVEEVELKNTYKRRYKMRSQGQNGLNTVVSMPRAVLEREAAKKGLSVKKFIEHYRAVALYNSFDGIFYTFEKVGE